MAGTFPLGAEARDKTRQTAENKMELSGHISLSRQLVLKRELEVIANNLANMNTNAFRGERLAFAKYVKETGNGDQITFVQGVATVRDLTEGQKVNTHNDLDVAIAGEGYFEVESEGVPLYTRDGAFRLNQDSELITRHGYRVLDTGGAPIRIPSTEGAVSINSDGTVSTVDGPLGKLRVVRFENEQALAKLPGGLYDADGMKAEEAEDYVIQQGVIETSNVVGIAEMARMIDATKNYRSAHTMAKEENERQKKAIQVLGSRMMF